MSTPATTRLRAAPGRYGCCDAPGELLRRAQQPVTDEQLVAWAIADGWGTREQTLQLIQDMTASGMLLELDGEASA